MHSPSSPWGKGNSAATHLPLEGGGRRNAAGGGDAPRTRHLILAKRVTPPRHYVPTLPLKERVDCRKRLIKPHQRSEGERHDTAAADGDHRPTLTRLHYMSEDAAAPTHLPLEGGGRREAAGGGDTPRTRHGRVTQRITPPRSFAPPGEPLVSPVLRTPLKGRVNCRLRLNQHHSAQETSVSTFDGIGSFSHRPFSLASQTPSFGMTKRKRAGTSLARIVWASP